MGWLHWNFVWCDIFQRSTHGFGTIPKLFKHFIVGGNEPFYGCKSPMVYLSNYIFIPLNIDDEVTPKECFMYSCVEEVFNWKTYVVKPIECLLS